MTCGFTTGNFCLINYVYVFEDIDRVETRRGFSCQYPHVSNKMIFEKQFISSFTTIISNSQNLNILVYCTMPIDKINDDQRVFIQAIINEIIMLFIILNSSYYKNGNNVFEEIYLMKN